MAPFPQPPYEDSLNTDHISRQVTSEVLRVGFRLFPSVLVGLGPVPHFSFYPASP